VWLRRYAADEGLGDRSSRPHGCPHQMSPATEARIVEMRRAHPGWGADRIGYQLHKDGIGPVPGRTSIYRALVRNGLVVSGRRKRRRADYRRWERARPMELWQMDVVGGFHLADGTELKAVSGIDDSSRFAVSTVFDTPPRNGGKPWTAEHFDLMVDLELPVPLRYDHDRIFDLRGLAYDLGTVERFAITQYPIDRLLVLGQIAENGYGDSVLADLRKSLSYEFFAPDWGLSIGGWWDGEDQAIVREISLTRSPAYRDARVLAVGEDAIETFNLLTEQRAAAA
jgi:Homeodomain-like domain